VSRRVPSGLTDVMHAVGFRENLPVDDPSSLVDFTVPIPAPGPHDVLVRVRAASVNPVDTKIRRFSPAQDGAPRILGFDAAGTVVAVGSDVSRFTAGDDVFYAGTTNRPGRTRSFRSSTNASSGGSRPRWILRRRRHCR
jgi:NADPH2:quinone reductase